MQRKNKLVSQTTKKTCKEFNISRGEILCTFTHVADLLLEHVVAVFIHVSPQEVLEAVVDLQPGRHHGHPLPHSVALPSKETRSDPRRQTGKHRHSRH